VAQAFSCRRDLAEACDRSLAGALNASATDPEEIVAAFAGANGSRIGDAEEASALYKLLGERVPVCAVKGSILESAGASALVQLVAAILSVKRAAVPPTAGFRVQDPELPPLRLSSSRLPLPDGRLLVHAWDDSCCSAATVLRIPPARRDFTPSGV
jgi:3-oxoacyl-(acyl-carrier-protein) synthase